MKDRNLGINSTQSSVISDTDGNNEGTLVKEDLASEMRNSLYAAMNK